MIKGRFINYYWGRGVDDLEGMLELDKTRKEDLAKTWWGIHPWGTRFDKNPEAGPRWGHMQRGYPIFAGLQPKIVHPPLPNNDFWWVRLYILLLLSYFLWCFLRINISGIGMCRMQCKYIAVTLNMVCTW